MLYNIFISLYQFIISILKKYNRKIRIRENEINKTSIPIKSRTRIWLHCASAGEYEQSLPLIHQIKKYFSYEICISFYSTSGMEYYLQDPTVDFVFYLPIDTQKNSKTLIKSLEPDYVIWLRYEFWQNILAEIFQKKIPSVLLFTDLKQLDHKFILEKNRRIHLIKQFHQIYSITDYYHPHIQYQLVNDGKWEKALQNKKVNYDNEILEKLDTNNNTILLGSAHLKDVEILNQILDKFEKANNYNWVIVPHEIDMTQVQKIENTLSIHLKKSNIYIINQLGILKYLYRYADIAWIGGGFGKSVHNVLEAAAYNIPIVCGPNISKVDEAMQLKDQQTLFTFQHSNELIKILLHLNEEQRSQINNRLQTIFNKNAVDHYSTYIIQDIQKKLSGIN